MNAVAAGILIKHYYISETSNVLFESENKAYSYLVVNNLISPVSVMGKRKVYSDHEFKLTEKGLFLVNIWLNMPLPELRKMWVIPTEEPK